MYLVHVYLEKNQDRANFLITLHIFSIQLHISVHDISMLI